MTIILELSPEREAALKAQAHAQGVSAEHYAVQVLGQLLGKAAQEGTLDHPPEAADGSHALRPLTARIRALWSDMPDEVRAEYPEGGAYQIDHHVYGLPKR